MSDLLTVINADCRTALRSLPDASVQCCVTSPPYFGLRDYGNAGQIGLEASPDEFVSELVSVFSEVRRVVKDDGTLWLNLGDSYNAYNGGAGPSSKLSAGAQTHSRPKLESGFGLRFKGLKPKDLIGIPWRVAFALQADGWYLRQDIIWHKPNPMPESVGDRCTKAHEYIFLLTKAERYRYDAAAIFEPSSSGDGNSHYDTGKSAVHGEGRAQAGPRIDDGMRNKRSVWSVSPARYQDAHFATFPPELITPMILAGSGPGDVVLDPFGGSGTTGMVAIEMGRRAVLIEINPDYCELIQQRCTTTTGFQF